MRIGIYDPYFDDLGGGEKYMMTIAECLAKQHQVDLFWDIKEDLYELLQRFSLNLHNVSLTKNIFSAKVGFWEKLIATSHYDVIIFLSDGSIPFTFSKKLFLHLQQPLKHIAVSSWKKKLKRSKITAIFYNSQFTKSFNEKILPGLKSFVIYPPVPLKIKIIAKENIILHVGRFRVKNVGITDYKKQGVMIEVFKQMTDQKKIKNWKFIIAASVKKEDEETFALLKKNAKGYPIEFFVNKSNDDLWDIYNKAKIYWHASGFGEDLNKHPEYAEHFGISTVEAMGAGAVPIVINAGGQKEIITENKNGFLWNTLEELQRNTERVMNDPQLWKRLSDGAMIRAKDFSKEKFCEAVTKMVSQ